MVCPLLKPIIDLNTYNTKLNKFNPKTIFKDEGNYYSVDLNNSFKFNEIKNKIPPNEDFKACLIKITNHIGINIYFDFEYLIIIESNLLKEKVDFDEFDESKHSCFGNLIVSRNGKGYFKKIKYSDINFILPRVYYFNKNSYEIYTKSHKSFYFKFIDEETSNKFYEKIKEKTHKDINIINKFHKHQMDWRIGNISNLEYLMYLNIFSNRSYRDITQYPVFPWILRDYNVEEKNIFNLKYRNFSLPLGMMEITEKGKRRKDNYILTYNSSLEEIKEKEKEEKNVFQNFWEVTKKNFSELFQYENIPYENLDISEVPYMFGSHFSNFVYISHYLIRLFPFSLTAIEIQGNNFDAPDRLFININKSFLSAVSDVSDLREIIPEFFILPEMFINLNKLNFGKLQKNNKENSTYQILKKKEKKEDIYVNDVLLPCDNNPYKFVSQYRIVLEKKETKIEDWIDLIFGVNAKYENAIKNNNLYMNYCYDGIIRERMKKGMSKEEKFLIYKLFDLGYNPIPILNELNGRRTQYDMSNNSKAKDYYNEKGSILGKKEKEEHLNVIKLFEDNINDNDYIIKQFDSFFIYGTENGNLFIFSENNKLKKIIQSHSNKIIDIYINDKLYLLIDISIDGFLNIYNSSEFELIRSIKININEDDKFKKIFLSSSPLPSIIIQTEKKFISYSINGKYLNEINYTNSNKDIFISIQNFSEFLNCDNKTYSLPFFTD